MIRTIEAVIETDGHVRLLEAVRLETAHRALVTILDDAPFASGQETALLSEAALAKDWDRPEEDEAWEHLQSER